MASSWIELSRAQVAAIEGHEWFCSLPAPLRHALICRSTVQHVRARFQLGAQGEVPQSWYCIAGGVVKLTATAPGGQEKVVDLLGPGEWFGGISLLERLPLPYGAETWSASTLLMVSAGSLRHVYARHPELAPALLRQGWRRSCSIVDRTCLSDGNLVERTWRELVRLHQRFGIPSEFGTELPFHLTQAELAGLLSASRQRVNEVIGTLEEQGKLLRSRGQLQLIASVAQEPSRMVSVVAPRFRKRT